MSVILVDLDDEKNDLQINWWNWRATVELIRPLGLLSEDQLTRVIANGCGGEVSVIHAREIAGYLQREIIPRLNDGEMMHQDGRISPVPIEPRPLSGTPADDLCAARKTWLVKFAAFCRECGGFKVV